MSGLIGGSKLRADCRQAEPGAGHRPQASRASNRAHGPCNAEHPWPSMTGDPQAVGPATVAAMRRARPQVRQSFGRSTETRCRTAPNLTLQAVTVQALSEQSANGSAPHDEPVVELAGRGSRAASPTAAHASRLSSSRTV